MVGSDLCPVLRDCGHEVVPTDLIPKSSNGERLDIRDEKGVRRILEKVGPDWVIHLAAETDVDRCELEPQHAYESNAVGTEWIVRGCQAVGSRLLYMSTAGVFDGEKDSPYVETDEPNPVNVYGRTKLAGEMAVRRYLARSVIVRAGWMVGGHSIDKKFVMKILKLLEKQSEISVVTDKTGSLTFTKDLAQGLARLIGTDHVGLFHMANRGSATRFDVALKIVEYLGREDVIVKPISSAAFPLPAPRARSEVMENQRLQSLGLDYMPSWEASLRSYVQTYVDRVRGTVSVNE